jgi:putative MATE family efflux protein
MEASKGVEILLGDPKKALIKLSVPIMVNNLVFTLYNLADGVWVAGLGADALSAIGIFFPIFIVFIAISMGLGVGASSAISRRIGARKREAAEKVAAQTLILGLILSIILTSSVTRLEFLLRLLGAEGRVLDLSMDYSRVILFGSLFLFLNNVSTGVMNGEGSTKLPMYSNVIGTILNIILDPIFIYFLGLGIAGAAYATVVSMAVSSAVFLYWFFGKRTYIKLKLRWFDRNVFDVLRVGLPASFSMMAMSVSIVFLNRIIIGTTGSDGIAVFTSAWRFIQIGFIPMFGIAGALTSVVGASFGARDGAKLKTAYLHAIKTTALIEMAVAASLILLSPQIAFLFTYSPDSSRIYDDLVQTIRMFAIFLPFVPFGMSTVSMFQGIGKGENGLAITVLRTLVFQISFAYVLAIRFGFIGVVAGVVAGNVSSSLIAFTWGSLTTKRLEKSLVKVTT